MYIQIFQIRVGYAMDVRIASEKDKEQWNAFVDREHGSFFQYFDWKYVYESENLQYIPLLIEDGNSDIRGIFPLVEEKGYLYPWLSSLPEGATGGFLFSSSLDSHEKSRCLKSFFQCIDRNYSQTHAVLRIKEHLLYEDVPAKPTGMLLENGCTWLDNSATNLPCTHILKLDPRFEEKIWNGLFSKRLKKSIRHVKKTGLKVITDENFEYFDDFVEMQCQMGKKFEISIEKDELYKIFEVFRNKIKLFIAVLDSRPIAASFCYFTPTTFYLSKGPYLPVASEYLTNTFPNCASIRYACEKGFKYVEIGITHTENLAYHKQKWGSTRIPMRIYTKKFSEFKASANKTYGYLHFGKKKIVNTLCRVPVFLS